MIFIVDTNLTQYYKLIKWPAAARSRKKLSKKSAHTHLLQALFFCNFCVFFRLVVPFGDLLFIRASTNATDNHKYSPLPSADFDSSRVLVSFLELHFK